MYGDDYRGIEEVIRDLKQAHARNEPPERIFELVKEFYGVDKYRRDMQDIAILAIIKKLENLDAADSKVIDAGLLP